MPRLAHAKGPWGILLPFCSTLVWGKLSNFEKKQMFIPHTLGFPSERPAVTGVSVWAQSKSVLTSQDLSLSSSHGGGSKLQRSWERPAQTMEARQYKAGTWPSVYQKVSCWLLHLCGAYHMFQAWRNTSIMPALRRCLEPIGEPALWNLQWETLFQKLSLVMMEASQHWSLASTHKHT